DTKIILDRHYYDSQTSKRNYLGDGYELASKLHEKGYTNLFMITGDEPDCEASHDYLTVVFKEDDEKIAAIIKHNL
ncbi:MAG: hypothetical protein K0R49_836, partial [Burkholderiales bacterium]|nr:hypothetical protein [Burkholderiales bacterium]